MSFIKHSNVAMQVAGQSLNIVNNIEDELHNVGLQTSGTSRNIILNSNLSDRNAVQIIASSTKDDGGSVLIQSTWDDDASILLDTTSSATGYGGITLLPGINSGIHIGNKNGLVASSINIDSGIGRIYIGSGSVASTSEVNIGNTSGGTTFIGDVKTSVAYGYSYYDTIPSSGSTCNSKVGTASFTATTISNGDTFTFTINNTHAGTVGTVSMTCSTDVTGAIVQMQSITWNQNSDITIVVKNVGSQSTGSVTFKFSFMSFN